MRELFVWYRVSPPKADAARRQVHAAQAALTHAFPGLRARLLVRHGGPEAQATWMETYARPSDPGGVDAALEAEIERRAEALDGLIEGGRHAEAFEAAG